MTKSRKTVGALDKRASHNGVSKEELGEERELCGAGRSEGVRYSRPMRSRELL